MLLLILPQHYKLFMAKGAPVMKLGKMEAAKHPPVHTEHNNGRGMSAAYAASHV